MLLSNSLLKNLKLSLTNPNFVTKVSREEPKNWKLSIKINLLLIIKLLQFLSPFSMAFSFKIEFS